MSDLKSGLQKDGLLTCWFRIVAELEHTGRFSPGGLDPRLVTFLWELKKNATKVSSTSIAGYSLSAFFPFLPSFPSFTPPPL